MGEIIYLTGLFLIVALMHYFGNEIVFGVGAVLMAIGLVVLYTKRG